MGGARPGRNVLTLVASMLAGGSHIDHADQLREKGLGLLAFPGLDKLYDAGGVFTVYRGISHVNLRSKAMPRM